MNREILFRGKRADNGAWETGSRVAERMGTSEERIFIADKMTGYHTPIIPSTAGQYTGLTDRNGVRIFEGDIVNVKTISGSFINYVITWFNSDLCWVMQSLKDTSVKFRLRSCWEFEVVDNIHDNPELLKGEPNV